MKDARMEEATWVRCRPYLALDGGLVDLLVLGTGPGEWEAFWAALRTGPFELRAFRNGDPLALPRSAAWVFAEREEASVVVAILVSPITGHCHFFGGDLEVDIDPREVTGEIAFGSMLALMRFVAWAVRLPVFAMSEGDSVEMAFLRVSPEGRIEFLGQCR